MNPKIILSLRYRSKLSKRYYSNPTEENKNLLTAKSNECSKNDRWGQRKVLKQIKSEIKWSFHDAKGILKRHILNKKKIPNNLPLNVNDKIISNFDKKAELFNSHFSFQYTPVSNSSVLPPLEYKTNG